MSKKKETKMFRFIVFVAVIWFVSQIAKLLFRSMARQSSRPKSRGEGKGGTQKQQAPPIEFKDVQDAEFKDITEKEKEPK